MAEFDFISGVSSHELGNVRPPDNDTTHRARLTVCRAATSHNDAHELLAMLGLLPAPARRHRRPA